MTLDEVRRVIAREEDALRAKGVSAVYIFGSVARGEAGPESDVDVMIDIEPGHRFSILDLASVQESLAHRLGTRQIFTPATACTTGSGIALSLKPSGYSDVLAEIRKPCARLHDRRHRSPERVSVMIVI